MEGYSIHSRVVCDRFEGSAVGESGGGQGSEVGRYDGVLLDHGGLVFHMRGFSNFQCS